MVLIDSQEEKKVCHGKRICVLTWSKTRLTTNADDLPLKDKRKLPFAEAFNCVRVSAEEA